ncbi:MAG: aminopeptidase P family protein [Simkaniaceae bacterium]|nr:aminopeptidase P family protein [Simkaniaceae bacterium]
MSQERIKRLSLSLAQAKLDAFVVTDETHLFYLTGVSLSNGYLLITPKKHVLYLAEMSIPECDGVEWLNVQKMKKGIFHFSTPKKIRLGFDPDMITHSAYLELKKQCAESGCIRLVPSSLLQEMRIIKTIDEWQLLNQAATIVYDSYEHLKRWIKEGMSEIDIAREFERVLREKGGEEHSFSPIVAINEHAAIPHHRPKERRLKRDEPLLLDLGVKYRGYCSDMTRMICLDTMPSKIAELYRIAKQAHDEALKACTVGTPIADIDRAARDVIRHYGYDKQFIHSLGHGIGLWVHETPFLRPKKSSAGVLKEGMVFTIEPGIYLPNIGGVRYENMVYMDHEKAHLFFPV